MTSTVDAPMADVRDMYMAHAALRREFRLLPQLIRDVAPGDTARAEVVGAHAELICRILHTHHEGEDLLLWPKLLQRGGDEAASIVPMMEEQHHAIDKAHAEATGLLPAWRSTGQGGEELAGVFEVLLAVLLTHMTTEEKWILPLAEKHVTAAEWRELGEHGMAATPKETCRWPSAWPCMRVTLLSSRPYSATRRCPSACWYRSSGAAATPPTHGGSMARPGRRAWAPSTEDIAVSTGRCPGVVCVQSECACIRRHGCRHTHAGYRGVRRVERPAIPCSSLSQLLRIPSQQSADRSSTQP